VRSIAIALCFAVTAISAFAGERANSVDSCRAQMPASLITAVAMKFPGFRAPLESDNQPEDIQYNRRHGGSGCLGVARGNYTSDHANEFLLDLTPLKGKTGQLVVARRNKDEWSFDKLSNSELRSALFVETVKPGKYVRTDAFGGPLEAGEVQSMRCSRQGADFGEVGSAEIVYCFNGTKWRHVQISD
jgi:hypothetical protein